MTLRSACAVHPISACDMARGNIMNSFWSPPRIVSDHIGPSTPSRSDSFEFGITVTGFQL